MGARYSAGSAGKETAIGEVRVDRTDKIMLTLAVIGSLCILGKIGIVVLIIFGR